MWTRLYSLKIVFLRYKPIFDTMKKMCKGTCWKEKGFIHLYPKSIILHFMSKLTGLLNFFFPLIYCPKIQRTMYTYQTAGCYVTPYGANNSVKPTILYIGNASILWLLFGIRLKILIWPRLLKRSNV